MDFAWLMYEAVKLLNCIIEIFLVYMFLRSLFPVYEKRRYVRWAEAGICTGIIFFVNHLEMPFVNLVCVPLIYMLIIWLIYWIRFNLNVLYVIFYYTILVITEFVVWHFFHIFGIDVTVKDHTWAFRLLLEKCLIYLALVIIRKNHRYAPDKEGYPILKNLLILPVSVLILLNGFLLANQHRMGYLLIYLGSAALLVSNIAYFLIMDKLLLREKDIQDNEMRKLKAELERSHYRHIDEINQEYAEYIHEMRHIVKAIEDFVNAQNDESLKKFSSEASKLLKRKSPADKKMYIEDPIVNGMLVERMKEANKNGIRFKPDIQKGVSLDFMDETDKIRILGNLLDNALEAAGKCEHGYVNMSLYIQTDSTIILRVINNFSHKNQKQEGIFMSIKSGGRRHGFGLQKVKELAGRYKGSLKIEEENERFTAIVSLRNMY